MSRHRHQIRERHRLGVRDGIELILLRDRPLWRRWRWLMFDHNHGMQLVDGRAWTQQEAAEHGAIARALRVEGNRQAEQAREQT